MHFHKVGELEEDRFKTKAERMVKKRAAQGVVPGQVSGPLPSLDMGS